MNERDFCCWLQGLFDHVHPEDITTDQLLCIKDTLFAVFKQKPPILGGPVMMAGYSGKAASFGPVGQMSSMGDGGQLANLKK